MLRIEANNVISDAASVYLDTGTSVVSTILINFTSPGMNETINKLYFDDIQQQNGTWGATGSGSQWTNDTVFVNSNGIITVTDGPGVPPVKGVLSGNKFIVIGSKLFGKE